MVVDHELAGLLRQSGEEGLALFVACCAERMAQLFTGLRGADSQREADVATFVAIMDALWLLERSETEPYERGREFLESLPEMQPAETELVDVADIYAFYAALVARYACAFRAGRDSEDVLRCAHAALTAMGQLEQNIEGSNFLHDERSFQLADVARMQSGDEPAGARDVNRGRGMVRLSAVHERLDR